VPLWRRPGKGAVGRVERVPRGAPRGDRNVLSHVRHVLPRLHPLAPMNIAHIGPPLARRGGSSGYMWQLAAAESRGAGGAHRVTFPRAETPKPASPGPSLVQRIGRAARAALFGKPSFYRPSHADLTRAGGAIDTLLRESAQATCVESAAAIDAARTSVPDVLFA